MSMVVVIGFASAVLVLEPTTTGHAGSMLERRAPLVVPKTENEALRAQVYAAFPRAMGRWGAVHVVDRECSVSRAVVAHLIDRGASPDLDELVVVIDHEGATRREDVELVHAGYRVRVVKSERRADVVSVATPSMIVARSDGTLAYVGGHRRARGGLSGGATGEVEGGASGAVVGAAIGAATGFIDTMVTSELVVAGTTSIAVPVIGCVR